MAKGNRKRSEKPKLVEKEPKKPIKEKTIYDEFPARTLDQSDATRLKEIFTLSNNVAALIKDYADKVITIKNMRKMAEQIEQEKQPLLLQVAKNMFKTEKKYKDVAKDIREQADTLEKSLILIHGQIEHRYEDYVSTLVRQKAMIDTILNGAGNKKITGHRSPKEVRKQEELIFEKEFDESGKLTEEERTQLDNIQKQIKNTKKKAKAKSKKDEKTKNKV